MRGFSAPEMEALFIKSGLVSRNNYICTADLVDVILSPVHTCDQLSIMVTKLMKTNSKFFLFYYIFFF